VLFDFALYCEALNLDLGSGDLLPRLRLQPYVGRRYQYFGLEVTVRPRPGNRRLFSTSNAAAPILGLRGFLDIDENWNISFTGDGGGFGVDDVHKTWQAELLGGYRLRFQRFDGLDLNLLVGYKGVGVDVKSGTKDLETDII
jgi:hypothetical protein